jgi:hypothetical protein
LQLGQPRQRKVYIVNCLCCSVSAADCFIKSTCMPVKPFYYPYIGTKYLWTLAGISSQYQCAQGLTSHNLLSSIQSNRTYFSRARDLATSSDCSTPQRYVRVNSFIIRVKKSCAQSQNQSNAWQVECENAGVNTPDNTPSGTLTAHSSLPPTSCDRVILQIYLSRLQKLVFCV